MDDFVGIYLLLVSGRQYLRRVGILEGGLLVLNWHSSGKMIQQSCKFWEMLVYKRGVVTDNFNENDLKIIRQNFKLEPYSYYMRLSGILEGA